ncbi:hypothetical protein BDF20DRAFT_873405 [Mycotypha africana]|uniref:uncharacterized protein n=1 Tax=Mycotypha africana TaxID=64632 RepID=UPI00230041A4|nr:uncharacterized protein BDF20DRAFT_873405 [Mycotypha africana]KAI8977178.1 hypothetical protein BDF20DRAFT_873405 [Mycotypha africana]
MLYFTAPTLDCDDPAVLLSVFNSTSEAAKEECLVEEWKRYAARYYFAGCIINAFLIIASTLLFIYCATAPPIATGCMNFTSKSDMRRLRQAAKQQSLGKRSIAATTLGALGHLILSTSLFLNLCFDDDIGCQLSLWGVLLGFYTWLVAIAIRAYRLKFLYKLNRLRVKYLRMTRAERLAYVSDNDYQWYIKNSRQKKFKLLIPYVLFGLSICIMLIITIPTEIASMKANDGCYFAWGSITMICLYAFYICVMVPVMLWTLRHVSDAHGIRKEIWADAVVSIPFFTVYAVRLSLTGYGHWSLVFDTLRVAGPGLFSVFFTMVAHFISVVVPVIEYFIPIEQNKYYNRLKAMLLKYICCVKKRKLSNCSHITTANFQEQPQQQQPLEQQAIIPELSIDSLELVLADHEMMEQLQVLAIEDFSSENVVFYENYLTLQEMVKNRIFLNQPLEQTSFGPRKLINALTPTTIPFKNNNSSNVEDAEKALKTTTSATVKERGFSLAEFLSYPVPYDTYPLLVRFYESFIRDGAADQVNISHRARRKIDDAFCVVYEEYPELREFNNVPHLSRRTSSSPKIRMTSSCTSSSKLRQHSVINRSTIYFDQHDTTDEDVKANSNNDNNIILNLNIFEAARVEVCWNIFNSIYPKFVEMYKESNVTI